MFVWPSDILMSDFVPRTTNGQQDFRKWSAEAMAESSVSQQVSLGDSHYYWAAKSCNIVVFYPYLRTIWVAKLCFILLCESPITKC